MGLIQDAIKKWKDKRARTKEYEDDMKMHKIAEMKQLDSDERELMRFQEEDRKKQVKAALEKYRKKMQDRIWNQQDGNPAYTPNVVAGQKNLFHSKSDLFNRKDLFFKGGK